MEIQKVYVKTRADFGKQCMFDLIGPTMDVEIFPNLVDMNDYILRSHCHVGSQYSKQLGLHELQTLGKTTKNSGMFHFEGGWPKEINPRDEETTSRFRRRVEKDDNWAPKLRKLFEMMEHSILQNGAVNIYQHYFDDMTPTQLVQPVGLRTVNVYADPETSKRPVTDISWSPDSGSRIVVSYCFLQYGRQQDYSNKVYIWQVDNPNEPYMALEPFSPCVVCEFNPRDPSVLASGLMSGQVCNWDLRTGNKPVQTSHLLASHRDYTNAVRWLTSKSNTEFFSASSDGYAMWWDTRQLRGPTETLMFDFQNPNEPNIDRAIGVSCLNYGPMIGAKFMFGMDNGIIVTGSRKMKTTAEKLAIKLKAHYGPVRSVDRNVFNPAVFLTVGDWTARVWAEDTREGCLVATPQFIKTPTGGCWNKARCSAFYVMTATGRLTAWDLLQGLEQPVVALQLCKESLTSLAPYDEGTLIAVGNMVGTVFLVESTEFLQSFDKKDRIALSEYLERRSKVTKAMDVRLREIKLTQKIMEAQMEATKIKEKGKPARKPTAHKKDKGREKEKEKDKAKLSRESRGSKRKSASKERKKRDESPTLMEAEQKYLEMVQKGIDEYSTESDPNLRPVAQQAQTRKQERRIRRASEAVSEEDDVQLMNEQQTKEMESKMKEEMRERRKTRRIQVKKRPPLKVAARVSEGSITEKIPTQSTSKLVLDASKRRRRRGPKTKISFSLPIPCKGEVCKPRVCCWREGVKEKRSEKPKIEERKSSIDSVQWAASKPTKRRGKQARILQEMMEPPSDLTLEVQRAREEIREATLRARVPKTRILREAAEIRAKEARKEQEQKRGSKQDVGEKLDTWSEETSITEEDDEEEKGKKTVPPDPCSARKAKDIVGEFSSILGIPLPSISEEKSVGKAHLEQAKLAQTRVYPRISEYQGHIE
uniref:dynein intermediate chain 3, ciliary-like isoform X1 n=1 Tax=Osmia lignaria TaxID=473952 RepID=UPI001478083F|nr:dynein intermediate chain 3, ciliary-like isoform X1 [Osmia lignaria]XP_034180595.1 dynein intermediate chain 3, ciliary-like isoform X1 [Osmia lignaria]XP_034180596.1 dynein intermediate chain 3, ciliary-like isoform X1 [Osmia lignaria]